MTTRFPYKEQIKGVLRATNEPYSGKILDRQGVSLQAIKKFLNATPAEYRYINDALRKRKTNSEDTEYAIPRVASVVLVQGRHATPKRSI